MVRMLVRFEKEKRQVRRGRRSEGAKQGDIVRSLQFCAFLFLQMVEEATVSRDYLAFSAHYVPIWQVFGSGWCNEYQNAHNEWLFLTKAIERGKDCF